MVNRTVSHVGFGANTGVYVTFFNSRAKVRKKVFSVTASYRILPHPTASYRILPIEGPFAALRAANERQTSGNRLENGGGWSRLVKRGSLI